MNNLSIILALIAQTEERLKIPEGLLQAVCTVESGLVHKDPEMDGGSRSYSICQVKNIVRTHLKLKGDLNDVHFNIDVAGRYLKFQYNRYLRWDMAVRAYNLGHSSRNRTMNDYQRKVLNEYTKIIQGRVNRASPKRYDGPDVGRVTVLTTYANSGAYWPSLRPRQYRGPSYTVY